MSDARQLQRRTWFTSDIGRCRKCGQYVPCKRRTAQGKDWIDSNGKMEPRHPVDIPMLVVSFGRSVIIAELWRPEVAESATASVIVTHAAFGLQRQAFN